MRGRSVARADRDQAARDREIAAHAAAVAQKHRDQVGRAQDGAHDRPQHARQQRRRGDRDSRHHHRGLDAVALPDDRDVARTVGEPDGAERQQRDQREKKKTRIIGARPHGAAFSAATASAASRRLASTAASRASALAIQASAGARASAGSLASSASAPAILPCAARCSMRVRIARGRRRAVLADRADAHELLGVGLQPVEKPPSRGAAPLRAARPDDGGSSGRALRRPARPLRRTAPARDRAGVGRQRLDDGDSAANGSPRSTALRSAHAATASREARSLPAAAARAVVCASAKRAVSLSILLLVSRSAASMASARRDSAATLSASDFPRSRQR